MQLYVVLLVVVYTSTLMYSLGADGVHFRELYFPVL